LKTSIELEEKMLSGVNKILAVTTDAQKVTVIGQIDAANKRLRSFRTELERLEAQKQHGGPLESTEEQKVNSMKADLQAQLKEETTKREALGKLVVYDKKKKNDEITRNLEIEILTSDRIIAKTKENLQILESGNQEEIKNLVRKISDSQASSDLKGHVFSQRQYFKPTDCGICGDSLWDSKNSGYECACKIRLMKRASSFAIQIVGQLWRLVVRIKESFEPSPQW
jgi:hypothetical protein